MGKKDRIFIHIPKTGGTTLNCAINGTNWQTDPDFNYRHILYETKESTAGDIFINKNYEKYKQYDIYMILRHPVDRLISEYYFLKDRKEFMGLLRKNPKSLEEYAKMPQTQNYMTSFLVGNRIFPKKPVGKKELERVLKTIETLPIYVGIFEEYEKSMEYLGSKMKIRWPKSIEVKRVTLNRPPLKEVDDQVKQVIEECNPLDMQLYNYCYDILKSEDIGEAQITFKKDKYGYIMKYTERFNLLTLFETSNSFIMRHNLFFKELNEALHNRIRDKGGRSYVISWNHYVFNAIREKVPDFGKQLGQQSHQDPLEFTQKLAKEIQKKYRTSPALKKISLKFEPGKLLIARKKVSPVSVIKGLFGKKS